MQLLVRPAPFADESLESYLLRLSQENGFERYALLSGAMRDALLQQDHQAAGAFPLELARVNVFHANRSSSLRVRALHLIEQLTDLAPHSLLQLALIRSAMPIGAGHACVQRGGVDIPLRLVRTRQIPVCPVCLSESAYIRQHWHYAPYVACHLHGHELLSVCPSCGKALDYQCNESFTHCRCGSDLRHSITPPASNQAIQISALICGARWESTNPLLICPHPSQLFGAIFWYWCRYHAEAAGQPASHSLVQTIDYFAAWPANFHAELDQWAQRGLLRQTRLLNETPFGEVFGAVLSDCRQLPFQDLGANFILRALSDYLTALVVNHPKTRQPNLGDILLSASDAAALLSTSVEQVFRLQQEGYLTLAYRLRRHAGLTPYDPMFHLRQVIEYRLAHGAMYPPAFYSFLPAW
ncbi:TniQ family protein [Aeromonas media]